MTISVQEGKRYVLANGEFVGPMLEFKGSGYYSSLGDVRGRLWRPDGKRYYDCNFYENIVKELEEPPITKEDSMSEPKQWQHMSPEEKGALLLAHHEGKVIELRAYGGGWQLVTSPSWADITCYRIKPEPIIGEVMLYGRVGGPGAWGTVRQNYGESRITFQTKDGKPVWSTLKGEDL